MISEFFIKRRFFYLLQNGYTFSKECKDGVYQVYYFQNNNYSVIISLDYRCEFIDMKIKLATEVVLETRGKYIVINAFEHGKQKFSSSLKEIYEIPRKSLSLSHKQIRFLIELYAQYATDILCQ